MSGGPEFLRTVVDLGLPSAFTEAAVRYVGDAGLVPRKSRGRPSLKNSEAAWGASHYAIAILALGTVLPIGAADAAVTLGSYVWVRSTRHKVLKDEGGRVIGESEIEDPEAVPQHGVTLSSCLEWFINMAAKKTVEQRQGLLWGMENSTIRLNLTRGIAAVSYEWEPGRRETDYYAQRLNALMGPQVISLPQYPDRPTFFRDMEITLPFNLVIVSGGLLAETWASSATDLPYPPSGDAPASAAPKSRKENAALPARNAAPPRKHDRPRANATGTLANPEVRGLGDFPQACSESRPVTSPKGDPEHARAYP
jgi:hypothetical protein